MDVKEEDHYYHHSIKPCQKKDQNRDNGAAEALKWLMLHQ